jgi:hypothetical protein
MPYAQGAPRLQNSGAHVTHQTSMVIGDTLTPPKDRPRPRNKNHDQMRRRPCPTISPRVQKVRANRALHVHAPRGSSAAGLLLAGSIDYRIGVSPKNGKAVFAPKQ